MNKYILLISSEFPPGPGGIGQHAFSLALALNKLNYYVVITSISDYSTKKEKSVFDLENQQIEIIRFKRYLPVLTQIIRFLKILSIIKKSSPKAIILTGRFSLIFNAIFGNTERLKKIKKIAVLHGSEVNPTNFLERFLNQKGIIKSDFVVSVSQFTKNLIPGKIKNLKELDKFRVIGNGLMSKALLDWEQNNNIIELKGYPKLITVGNVLPRKGQHLVVKAIPRLITEYPELHYHIVGIRRDVTNVDECINSNNLSKYCTFHGRVGKHSELASFYRSCDILMLLSENQKNGDVEGFGIVALEAHYFGVPVIGSKGTGVEEAVKDGFSGKLVDASDPNQILDAIDYILKNKDHFEKESKKWARENHWDELGKRFAEIIDNN
jgi:phosphatidylinositol alpha-1,6-mannosyltransferase